MSLATSATAQTADTRVEAYSCTYNAAGDFTGRSTLTFLIESQDLGVLLAPEWPVRFYYTVGECNAYIESAGN